MHHKLKNTLTGLFVALGMLSMSYTAGDTPRQPVAKTELPATLIVLQADDVATPVRKRTPSRKSQMFMPYFSFAPILPKQES